MSSLFMTTISGCIIGYATCRGCMFFQDTYYIKKDR